MLGTVRFLSQKSISVQQPLGRDSAYFHSFCVLVVNVRDVCGTATAWGSGWHQRKKCGVSCFPVLGELSHSLLASDCSELYAAHRLRWV